MWQGEKEQQERSARRTYPCCRPCHRQPWKSEENTSERVSSSSRCILFLRKTKRRTTTHARSDEDEREGQVVGSVSHSKPVQAEGSDGD